MTTKILEMGEIKQFWHKVCNSYLANIEKEE